MEAEVDKQMVDQGRKGWSANDSVKYTTRDKTYLFLPRLPAGPTSGPLALSPPVPAGGGYDLTKEQQVSAES